MVEKGIGWLLKEASRTQPKRVADYLVQNRARLSRLTLRYACEKLPARLGSVRLVLAGQRCEELLSERVRNVAVKDVQRDEIWGFVLKKEAHKEPEEASNRFIGDAYCFVAN